MTVSYPKVLLLLAASAVATGCASTSTTSASPGPAKAAYSNFLVIGVAGDYTNRAYFERKVVSGIKAKGSSASAFHVVAGGNKPLTREAVKDAIETGGFDAVVVTRVLDTILDLDVKDAVTDTKVTRKDGGALDLFRYDYEELDEPMPIVTSAQVTFAIELYDATSEQMTWSTESIGQRSENIGVLIDETAATVVKQLDRNNFIGQ